MGELGYVIILHMYSVLKRDQCAITRSRMWFDYQCDERGCLLSGNKPTILTTSPNLFVHFFSISEKRVAMCHLLCDIIHVQRIVE